MRIELVRIGNSRGVRIPKSLIEQCGFGDAIDLRVEKNCLVLSPEIAPRAGWEEAFQAAGDSSGDDLLLEPSAPSNFDREEWEW